MVRNIAEMKERIMNAVIEEFGKKGLRFTMDDISGNLGISKKTLYNVYDTKEAMFLDVADYCFADIKRSEQAILNDPDMDTLTKIREIIGVLPERYQNKGLSNLYLLREKYPAIYERVAVYLSSDWDATITLLNRGMEEGVIRKISIPILKSMVESTLQEFMGDRVLVENGISYEDALREMIEIIMNGIQS